MEKKILKKTKDIFLLQTMQVFLILLQLCHFTPEVSWFGHERSS